MKKVLEMSFALLALTVVTLGAGMMSASVAAAQEKEPKDAWTLEEPVPASVIRSTRQLREKLLADPYRPGYHFVMPEGFGWPFDPNGAIFWKGRYHLFYIFQDARTGKQEHHWGHVSSTDLFHWRHHPTTLVGGMFSGNCFINKDGVPTICYHDQQRGHNAMAIALDDELNHWKKQEQLITPETTPDDEFHGVYRSWDPYAWIEDNRYYAIFGGKKAAVAKSTSLEGPWEYAGAFLANSVEGVAIDEDISCADFFTIGDRRMLLCLSHRLGCRYYLGEWKNEQFHPNYHARMSWVDNQLFAPESLLDDRGRRIMWAWLVDWRSKEKLAPGGWFGTMCLPRVLTLADDGTLRMNPPEEIAQLRYNPVEMTHLIVEPDADRKLEDISGKSLELVIEMVPGEECRQFGVKVLCSPDGAEETRIFYDAAEKMLKVDATRSGPMGTRRVEAAPFELEPGEPLKLRIFVDKSVVDVFANEGRQAITRRLFPSADNPGAVRLFSQGGPATVTTLKAWDIMPANPY